ncbi:MAG TPA: DUF5677 domain-containing protein [Candidatus Acidoferrales bacterium]|nr:DUF5677 domain-containing protein [Candidatus Acidoferrales bacterium]
MSATAPLDSATMNADKFYTMVKSIHWFDTIEVKGVIDTLLSPTPRDNCFVGTYYRTLGNVETLLRLNKSKDFQAIAMLARALFELSVDSRLLQVMPDGWGKMLAFADVEKLRAANKVIGFKKKNPTADLDTTVYDSFVSRNAVRVTGLRSSIWPGVKKLTHWSGLNLSQRVAFVKSPFDQVYEVDYPRLSWYAHSGLTGILNVQAVTFIHLCAYAYHLAALAYRESLISMIREFKISKANEKIERQLRVANMLPFTDSSEQVSALMESIG